jgi:hypothetical protein
MVIPRIIYFELISPPGSDKNEFMRIRLLPAIALFSLAACATSRDTVNSGAAVPRGHSELPASSVPGELHGEKGLEIRSYPPAGAVYLNNRYQGVTPLVLSGLKQGRYLLEVNKEGYHPATAWIRYDEDYLLYEIDLKSITGFLKVRVLPVEADISAGDRKIIADTPVELPVGSYLLRLSAFGYEDKFTTAVINDERTTTVEAELEKAAFNLTPLTLSRVSFNPASAGLLGQVSVGFRVTARGRATVTVFDSALRQVHSRELDSFETWDQHFPWRGRDAGGAPLPDGRYLIRVEARGQGDESIVREVFVTIDGSRVTSHRSLYSGASGLLFAPTADLLSFRTVQLSSLALARIDGDGLRAPWNAGLRRGLTDTLELDIQAGFIFTGGPDGEENFIWPFFVSSALKSRLFATGTAARLEGALIAKLSYQADRRDSLTNFTGLSAALPCSLRRGRALLVASPELIVSPWTVSYDAPLDFEPDWSVWLYTRAGLLWDTGSWRLGLSAALRSAPLEEGLKPDFPFQGGLELHWLVPNTQLYLSVALAAELGSDEDFFAGGGLGLID